jgi:hypothetical protein
MAEIGLGADLTEDMPFLNALSRLTPGQTVPVVRKITVQVTPTERERATQ